MSYTKTTWATGDVVTSAKLNKMESGIELANNIQANINLTTLSAINSVTVDGNTRTSFYVDFLNSISLQNCRGADVASYAGIVENGGWLNIYYTQQNSLGEVYFPNPEGYLIGEFEGKTADSYPDGSLGVGTDMPFVMIGENNYILPNDLANYLVRGTGEF